MGRWGCPLGGCRDGCSSLRGTKRASDEAPEVCPGLGNSISGERELRKGVRQPVKAGPWNSGNWSEACVVETLG